MGNSDVLGHSCTLNFSVCLRCKVVGKPVIGKGFSQGHFPESCSQLANLGEDPSPAVCLTFLC